jgi:hypothetical protein
MPTVRTPAELARLKRRHEGANTCPIVTLKGSVEYRSAVAGLARRENRSLVNLLEHALGRFATERGVRLPDRLVPARSNGPERHPLQ